MPLYGRGVRSFPLNSLVDFKKGGAGLKYEVALSIHTNEIIWIRGPLPASVHDISMFRGCTAEQKKQKKIDKNAFIFHIPLLLGDSGCKFEVSFIIVSSFTSFDCFSLCYPT
mmetsp:Transcript_12006/g.24221  ORF Transcript_12006/g.24221 Transcript_12006/m.24221 type:complete len:112 (+) Transcript_12006:65-400(+)